MTSSTDAKDAAVDAGIYFGMGNAGFEEDPARLAQAKGVGAPGKGPKAVHPDRGEYEVQRGSASPVHTGLAPNAGSADRRGVVRQGRIVRGTSSGRTGSPDCITQSSIVAITRRSSHGSSLHCPAMTGEN
jgi:hypothetical protein